MTPTPLLRPTTALHKYHLLPSLIFYWFVFAVYPDRGIRYENITWYLHFITVFVSTSTTLDQTSTIDDQVERNAPSQARLTPPQPSEKSSWNQAHGFKNSWHSWASTTARTKDQPSKETRQQEQQQQRTANWNRQSTTKSYCRSTREAHA